MHPNQSRLNVSSWFQHITGRNILSAREMTMLENVNEMRCCICVIIMDKVKQKANDMKKLNRHCYICTLQWAKCIRGRNTNTATCISGSYSICQNRTTMRHSYSITQRLSSLNTHSPVSHPVPFGERLSITYPAAGDTEWGQRTETEQAILTGGHNTRQHSTQNRLSKTQVDNTNR